MIHPKSFQNMINISKTPSLNKFVKRIEYEATTFDSMEHDEWREHLPMAGTVPPMPEHPGYPLTERSKRLYCRQLKAWDMNYGPGSQFTRQELHNGWNAYQEIVDATEAIQMNYGDFSLMNKVFRAFPNLSAIEFSISQTPSETLKAAYAPTLMPIPLDDIDRELTSALGLRYLTPLLLALMYTGVKLTSFKAGIISWHAFHWPVNFSYHHWQTLGSPTVDFPWQMNPKELTPAFSHLREFHVVFEPELVTDFNGRTTKTVLGQVLKSATSLESMHIEFKERVFSSAFPPDQVLLDTLLGDVHWPRLKKLEVASIQVTEDYLVQHLKRHSKTLKTLKLGEMYLSHGVWASAFQRMRADLRLTSVAFEGTFSTMDDVDEDSNSITDDDEDDEDDDFYLNMDNLLPSDWRSILPLGRRLKTYFLNDGFRCPLETKETKAWLRSERKKLPARSGVDGCWRDRVYNDGLKDI